MKSPSAYSLPQRILHWLTAAVVLFNLLLPDGMNAWHRALRQTGTATPEQISAANIHAYAGIAVLLMVILRLLFRRLQGVPGPPQEEPAILRLAARLAHGLLYLLLVMMPLTGIGAYYLGWSGSGDVHADILKIILWLVLAMHVGGALAHQFYWKTNVLRRMTLG